MVVCGQEFTPELLGRISELIAQAPLSRRALSRQVCAWLNWRGRDDRLKQMSCRVALGKLARAGALTLPEPTAALPAARPVACEQVLLGVTVPVATQLVNLGRIEVLLVGSRASHGAHAQLALGGGQHALSDCARG